MQLSQRRLWQQEGSLIFWLAHSLGLVCGPYQFVLTLTAAKFLDQNKYQYKVICIHDEADCDLYRYFEESCQFITQCFKEGGKIFVHCNQGRSRSATIVSVVSVPGLIPPSGCCFLDESLQAYFSKSPFYPSNVPFCGLS